MVRPRSRRLFANSGAPTLSTLVCGVMSIICTLVAVQPCSGLAVEFQQFYSVDSLAGVNITALTRAANTGQPNINYTLVQMHYDHRAATFGPQSFDLTSKLVIASPPRFCNVDLTDSIRTELSNAGTLLGAWVLILRGDCSFAEKILNAQALGAAGVIVGDNRPIANSALFDMGKDANEATPVIPAVFVTAVAWIHFNAIMNGTFITDVLATAYLNVSFNLADTRSPVYLFSGRFCSSSSSLTQHTV